MQVAVLEQTSKVYVALKAEKAFLMRYTAEERHTPTDTETEVSFGSFWEGASRLVA